MSSAQQAYAIRFEDTQKVYEPRLRGAKKMDRLARLHTVLHLGGMDFLTRPFIKTPPAEVSEKSAISTLNLDIPPNKLTAIIGKNGAGKSTLLKLVQGIVRPTGGRILICGKVVSVIDSDGELDDEDSGVTNVFDDRELRQKSKRERAELLKRILKFAELEDFEHVPVKKYSTGMRMRLAIGMALCQPHDILLLDEVLGVGDIAFQEKVMNRVRELKAEEKTIALVTRDMEVVQQEADHVVWLERGELMAVGTPDEVLPQYRDQTKRSNKGHRQTKNRELDTDAYCKIHELRIKGEISGTKTPFRYDEMLTIRLDLELAKDIETVNVRMDIDCNDRAVLCSDCRYSDFKDNRHRIDLEVPGAYLKPESYAIALIIRFPENGNYNFVRIRDVLLFSIGEEHAPAEAIHSTAGTYPKLEWTCIKDEH